MNKIIDVIYKSSCDIALYGVVLMAVSEIKELASSSVGNLILVLVLILSIIFKNIMVGIKRRVR